MHTQCGKPPRHSPSSAFEAFPLSSPHAETRRLTPPLVAGRDTQVAPASGQLLRPHALGLGTPFHSSKSLMPQAAFVYDVVSINAACIRNQNRDIKIVKDLTDSLKSSNRSTTHSCIYITHVLAIFKKQKH